MGLEPSILFDPGGVWILRDVYYIFIFSEKHLYGTYFFKTQSMDGSMGQHVKNITLKTAAAVGSTALDLENPPISNPTSVVLVLRYPCERGIRDAI